MSYLVCLACNAMWDLERIQSDDCPSCSSTNVRVADLPGQAVHRDDGGASFHPGEDEGA